MSDHIIHTHLSGYPRIGERRELKKATEAFWKGALSVAELERTGADLRRLNWEKQRQAGIDLIPCNDFSFYDQMLDFSCLTGNVPSRFGWCGGNPGLEIQFQMARGTAGKNHDDGSPACCGQHEAVACEMTKWFDTNYHYIVPEFRADTKFELAGDKVFREFAEAQALGLRAKPVLPGPLTYLSLGKVHDPQHPAFDRWSLLDGLVDVYNEILQRLAAMGAEWVQLDEPVFSLDLTQTQRDTAVKAWSRIGMATPELKLIAANYFGPVRENLPLFFSLAADAWHVDLTRAPEELDKYLTLIPGGKILSLGVVDGRNIWRNDYRRSLELIERGCAKLGADRVWVAPSCSLQHVPVTLRHETTLDDELRTWLAFADEKLIEVATLSSLQRGSAPALLLEENEAANRSRRESPRIHLPAVKARLAAIKPEDTRRASPFKMRQAAQSARLQLPLLPTTTIGSFPQTPAVRALRARWKKGEITTGEYETWIEREIRACIAFQDEIGIDMPVHGEFERNDMVEYFGEQLDGFAFTANGWVQSYGTRCVKPPVIYGDVSRPAPMTVRWSAFARSCTTRPVKGMLTGPVTILQWSFVRDDQPRRETTRQIALAIRDEVADLENAGIAAIQIDEPALREGLPLRREDWQTYLDWAVEAFHLSAAVVRDDTQIHTHMCYAEFNDIITAIAGMDADVITIETSRSNMELLGAFVDFRYPNEIGPGVYDIHSPRVPSVEEMERLLRRAEAVIPRRQLWVNPDCGLKTRGWPEVKAALTNMVATAHKLRSDAAKVPGV